MQLLYNRRTGATTVKGGATIDNSPTLSIYFPLRKMLTRDGTDLLALNDSKHSPRYPLGWLISISVQFTSQLTHHFLFISKHTNKQSNKQKKNSNTKAVTHGTQPTQTQEP